MKLFYFFIITFVSLSLQAQTHTFTGNGGSIDWHTAANWSANAIPDNSSDVVIPDGFEVNIANTAVANSLTLSGSSTLILEASLTVSENFSIEDVAVFTFEDGYMSAGTIENNGTMRFINPAFKTIANTVINNHSKMDFISNNIIRLEGIVTINNLNDGVMDILANGGLTQANGATATLINDGIVKKYTENGDFGSFYMILNVTNNNIIDIDQENQFLFLTPQASLHNTSTGILTGKGIFDITALFINEGTVSPGGNNIGELHFINTFNLDGGTLLIDIEDEENYDKITVTGSPVLDGNIDVISSYLPVEYYTIDILTSQFTINNCDFPLQTVAQDNSGTVLTFDILCDTNKVSLALIDGFIFSVNENNNLNFAITPNPISKEALITLNNEHLIAAHLDIYSISGEKVKTIITNKEATIFYRETLADGMYFAQLVSEGKVIATEKIILK